MKRIYKIEHKGAQIRWSGWQTPCNQGIVLGTWYAYRGEMALASCTLGAITLMPSQLDCVDTGLRIGTPLLTLASSDEQRDEQQNLAYERLIDALDRANECAWGFEYMRNVS